MPDSGLSGPYRLVFDEVHAVAGKKGAGAFALGHIDQRGNFCIRYVGRSDDDVRARLCDLIGSEQFFKFSYVPTLAAAFLKECELFHDFRPTGNYLHPERPRGTSLECPRCHFGRQGRPAAQSNR